MHVHAHPLDVVVAVGLALGAGLYGIGAGRAGRRALPWPRRLAFTVGWTTLGVAVLSPIDRLAASLFWAHMVQHQLLMVVAAPLLVVSRPLTAMLRALPGRARQAATRWRRVAGAPWRELTRPSTGALAFALALWGWHVPALYEAALRSDVVHAAEHASFLGAGALFWWTVIRRRTDAGLAAICLFVTAAHTGVLGGLLTLAPTVWYPGQSVGAAGLASIEDQQLAGLVMWVPSGVAFVGAALVVLARWLAEAERRVSLSASERLARAAGRRTS